MHRFITVLDVKETPFYFIPNETTKGENFAEKWNKHPPRAKAFYEWQDKAQKDVERLGSEVGLDTVRRVTMGMLGEKEVSKAFNRYTEAVNSARANGRLKIKALTGLGVSSGIQRLLKNGKGYVKKNVLRWQGVIRPMPVSREYEVRILYRPGTRPATFIMKPSLKDLADGRVVPHLYSQKKQKLCLFMPRYGEWRPDQHISKTIIQWTYLWIFYFEEWLFSNKWKGGGEHPKSED